MGFLVPGSVGYSAECVPDLLLSDAKSSNSAGASTSNSPILQSWSAAATFAHRKHDCFVRLTCERFTGSIEGAQVCGCSRRSGWTLLTFGTSRSRRTRFASHTLRPCRTLQSSCALRPSGTRRTRRTLGPRRTLRSRDALRTRRTKRPAFAGRHTQRDQHSE
jgi:hypothetical protein